MTHIATIVSIAIITLESTFLIFCDLNCLRLNSSDASIE